MHMPGTSAATVLWTRATRLPQTAKLINWSSQASRCNGCTLALNPKPKPSYQTPKVNREFRATEIVLAHIANLLAV